MEEEEPYQFKNLYSPTTSLRPKFYSCGISISPERSVWEMSGNVRIQQRDKDVIQRIIDFNGLPGKEIVDKYFDGSRYGNMRLKSLEDNGYLKKIYYYAPRKKDGKVFTQRISAIYYATPKGLREVGCSIDSRFVIPDEEKLDVSNLVGKLFAKIPSLLSKRQAIEKYNLKNFIPISCAVDGDTPMFIYVLGNKLGRFDIGRIKGFTESGIMPHAKHYVVSRKFYDRLFLPNIHFVPWIMAPDILPNLAQDRNYYLREFLEIVKKEFPGIGLLSGPEPLIRAQYQNKILHIGELISGLNHIRLVLQDPPENTFIYAPSRRHFYGVKLNQGSFLFYSQKDQDIFEMRLRDSNMYSVPYKLKS